MARQHEPEFQYQKPTGPRPDYFAYGKCIARVEAQREAHPELTVDEAVMKTCESDNFESARQTYYTSLKKLGEGFVGHGAKHDAIRDIALSWAKMNGFV